MEYLFWAGAESPSAPLSYPPKLALASGASERDLLRGERAPTAHVQALAGLATSRARVRARARRGHGGDRLASDGLRLASEGRDRGLGLTRDLRNHFFRSSHFEYPPAAGLEQRACQSLAR